MQLIVPSSVTHISPSLHRLHAKHDLWVHRFRIPSTRALRQAVPLRHGWLCPLRAFNSLINLKRSHHLKQVQAAAIFCIVIKNFGYSWWSFINFWSTWMYVVVCRLPCAEFINTMSFPVKMVHLQPPFSGLGVLPELIALNLSRFPLAMMKALPTNFLTERPPITHLLTSTFLRKPSSQSLLYQSVARLSLPSSSW